MRSVAAGRPPKCCAAAWVTVISPTPPGTGVIFAATSLTDSKSTSPASLPSTRFMPTSITVAPGLTISAVMNRGRPMATIKMSALRATAGRSRVRLWQTVTVASPAAPRCISNIAIGLPTMSLRPDHDDVRTRGWNAAPTEHLQDAVRRAGKKPWATLQQPADVLRVKGVDIFQRVGRVEHAGLVDLIGQRQLDQHAVHGRVAVETVDQRQQLFRRGFRRQGVQPAVYAGPLTGPLLIAHVNLTARILADQDRRQTWRHGRGRDELGDFAGEFVAYLRRKGFAVNDRSGHEAVSNFRFRIRIER